MQLGLWATRSHLHFARSVRVHLCQASASVTDVTSQVGALDPVGASPPAAEATTTDLLGDIFGTSLGSWCLSTGACLGCWTTAMAYGTRECRASAG